MMLPLAGPSGDQTATDSSQHLVASVENMLRRSDLQVPHAERQAAEARREEEIQRIFFWPGGDVTRLFLQDPNSLDIDDKLKEQIRTDRFGTSFFKRALGPTLRRLEKTPEFQAAVAALESHPLVRGWLNTYLIAGMTARFWESKEVATEIILRFFEQGGIASSIEKVARSEVEKLVDSCTGAECQFDVLVPLVNFFSEQEFNLEQIHVRKLTPAERFLLAYRIDLPRGGLDYGLADFVAKFRYSEKKVRATGPIFPEASFRAWHRRNARISRMESALRCFTGKYVSCSGVVEISRDWLFGTTSAGWIANPRPAEPCSLGGSQVPALQEFWKQLNSKEVQSRGNLRIALERIGRTEDRDSHDDRLIDLMIAGEALFLRKSDKNKAELLVKGLRRMMPNVQPSEEALVRFGYKARNHVVHGAPWPPIPRELTKSGMRNNHEVTQNLHSLLRRAYGIVVHHTAQ